MALTLSPSFIHRLMAVSSEKISLQNKILDLKKKICAFKSYKKLPQEKENYLNPTDDGESSKESHGASNETQLGLRLDLLVSLNLVKGGCFKADLNNLKI